MLDIRRTESTFTGNPFSYSLVDKS